MMPSPPPDEKEQTKFLCVIAAILGSLVCFSTAGSFLASGNTGASNSQLAWAVCCGVISFILLVCYLVAGKVRPELTERFGPILFGFLVIWWIFAVGFLTGSSGEYEEASSCPADERISVFAETNNGYFAVWLSFSACFYYFYLSAGQLSYSMEGREFANGLVTVTFASLVEFCSAANMTSSDGWAVACGLIGFFAACAQMFLRSYAAEISKKTAPVVSIFLVIWWTFGVGFITSGSGPFFNTCCERANGFFSTWVAFLGSIYYCFKTVMDYEHPTPVILEGHDDESQGLTSEPPQQGGYQEPQAEFA